MAYDLSDPKDYKRAWSAYLWKDHGVLRLRFHNMHEVGGGMWRANQPSPDRLAVLKDQGFKTILNIRGTQPGVCYYDLEHEACDRLGMAIHDLPFGSREAPYVDRIERLVKIFETMEFPAMLHCKSGADRAGIISVLFLLIHEKRPFEEAIQHLSLKYLHVKAGKTGMLDHFFETYRLYNEHTPIEFMEWVRTVYDRQAVHDSFMANWWGSFLTERVLRRE
ncbi:MAG: sulfur transferase domain-containing protein [Maricaulis sp.]|jgi:protein tyrosine/serine phosphatase|nr:sulfur transferase domain-containing protein [Maricaulis sp.]MDG2044154.1 sulfur transferase domain-containing protein [Maricaulis sp.]